MLLLIILIILCIGLYFLSIKEHYVPSVYNKISQLNKLYPYDYYLPQSMIEEQHDKLYKHHTDDVIVFPLY